ncbi:protein FAM171B-like isoform X1 [Alosa sapidissima]|uniref:protein FAM171B-like isoform X1 n=1 Tax=Alosa sapidissima TaxID=34773 RepID=UPI001C0A1F51|nr:protein FAM171B-like isoform X1 [Alosa sapidissima]
MSEFPYFLLVTLLILREDGLRGLDSALIVTNRDVDNFVEDAQQLPELIHQQFLKTDVTESVAVFTLKVYVRDAASRQGLKGASVELFVNYVLSSSTLTSEDGSAVLRVPYSPQQSVTIVGSLNGYVLTPLPWKASKMPIFSSVTLSLVSQTQGNIWLFEDSVLITGKISESLPNVQFQKNLLTVPECNISTITAYLTVPQPTAEKSIFYNTMGVLISKSGYRSIELKPVAAVSVELSCKSREVQVTGPIQISLLLPDNSGLSVSDPVPAWAFDSKAGAWVNQGLGIVTRQDGALVWSYTAPHLGFWIAAPFPSSSGLMGSASHMDFHQHAYLLMAVLSGGILIVSGILMVLLCDCRCFSCVQPPKRTKDIHMDLFKRDQTTSTNSMYQQQFSFKDSDGYEDTTQKADVSNFNLQTNFSTHSNGRKLNHYVDSRKLPGAHQLYDNIGNVAQQAFTASYAPHYINACQAVRPEGGSDQTRAPVALSEKVLLSERVAHVYHQPVAVLQAAELLLSAEQPSRSMPATLPRPGAGCEAQAEGLRKDNLTQTHPRAPPLSETHRQRSEEQQASEGSKGSRSSARAWGHFNTLLESVSVPGTLNEAAVMGPLCSDHQGTSEQNLRELSKSKPSPHPRAWFVSLEGKPVAQIRHSVLDLHKCLHKASERRNTSLDSGVDMNEHVAGGGSRKMERERTFVRSTAPSSGGGRTQRLCSANDDVDLSSSESATTCTPEDPSLRSLLDGAGGAVPDIPEEQDGGADTSSAQEDSESRSTPSPRRLRKPKDKRRADRQRSTWLMKEERPLMKLN